MLTTTAPSDCSQTPDLAQQLPSHSPCTMKIDSAFVAIVTGGASGLGEACVDMLVQQGAKVAAFDMNDEQGQQLQAKNPQQILFCKCNVVDEQSVQAAIQQVVDKWGVIRAVVNAAGVGNPQKVVGKNHQPHDLKAFQFVVNINLIGTFNVLRLAAAEMAKHKPVDNDGQRGVIINVASVAAFDGEQLYICLMCLLKCVG